MRSEQETNRAIEQYSDMVKRICFLYLKSEADTEDIFQTVFLKYLLYPHAFNSDEHEKAWFARVTVNACKDLLKNAFRRRTVPIDEAMENTLAAPIESRELLESVLTLPEKYRTVIYLFYFEDYPAVEIAAILGKKENTIYTWLARGRELLKKQLGGDPLG